MSERKIVVPEGMLNAVMDLYNKGWVRNLGSDVMLRGLLEAALRWLSENPIVPDTDEGDSLISCHRLRAEANAFAEWQRRMFLAPGPQVGPAAQKILTTAQGCTFTPEEYKAIEHSVRTATHWQDSPKETR